MLQKLTHIHHRSWIHHARHHTALTTAHHGASLHQHHWVEAAPAHLEKGYTQLCTFTRHRADPYLLEELRHGIRVKGLLAASAHVIHSHIAHHSSHWVHAASHIAHTHAARAAGTTHLVAAHEATLPSAHTLTLTLALCRVAISIGSIADVRILIATLLGRHLDFQLYEGKGRQLDVIHAAGRCSRPHLLTIVIVLL